MFVALAVLVSNAPVCSLPSVLTRDVSFVDSCFCVSIFCIIFFSFLFSSGWLLPFFLTLVLFLSFCLSVYFHPVSPPFSFHFRYPLPVPSSSPIFGPIEVEPNAGTPRRRPLSFCPCCAHEGNVNSCIPSIHVPNCSWIYIGTLVNMWQFKYFTNFSFLSFLLSDTFTIKRIAKCPR